MSTPPLELAADLSADVPPLPETKPSAGLIGLVLIARYHQISAAPDQIAHDFAEPGIDFGIPQILLIAKHLGLAASRTRIAVERLVRTPLDGVSIYGKVRNQLWKVALCVPRFARVYQSVPSLGITRYATTQECKKGR